VPGQASGKASLFIEGCAAGLSSRANKRQGKQAAGQTSSRQAIQGKQTPTQYLVVIG